MEENNKATPLHEEQEVAKFRVDIADEFILLVYRNFAEHWWWEGLDIEATVDQDPHNSHRYVLHQTEDSSVYDSRNYQTTPYSLGYLEINRVTDDDAKPVDVRLVCKWNVVLTFWNELKTILEREFTVLNITNNSQQDFETIFVPKQYATWKKWKKVYKKIRGWYPGISYNEISRRLQNEQDMKGCPKSPDTIAKIIAAGDDERLETFNKKDYP